VVALAYGLRRNKVNRSYLAPGLGRKLKGLLATGPNGDVRIGVAGWRLTHVKRTLRVRAVGQSPHAQKANPRRGWTDGGRLNERDVVQLGGLTNVASNDRAEHRSYRIRLQDGRNVRVMSHQDQSITRYKIPLVPPECESVGGQTGSTPASGRLRPEEDADGSIIAPQGTLLVANSRNQL
jgi:hypothetical protein